jgi:hypothetical protein
MALIVYAPPDEILISTKITGHRSAAPNSQRMVPRSRSTHRDRKKITHDIPTGSNFIGFTMRNTTSDDKQHMLKNITRRTFMFLMYLIMNGKVRIENKSKKWT